jgi:hypothetical protein
LRKAIISVFLSGKHGNLSEWIENDEKRDENAEKGQNG